MPGGSKKAKKGSGRGLLNRKPISGDKAGDQFLVPEIGFSCYESDSATMTTQTKETFSQKGRIGSDGEHVDVAFDSLGIFSKLKSKTFSKVHLGGKKKKAGSDTESGELSGKSDSGLDRADKFLRQASVRRKTDGSITGYIEACRARQLSKYSNRHQDMIDLFDNVRGSERSGIKIVAINERVVHAISMSDSGKKFYVAGLGVSAIGMVGSFSYSLPLIMNYFSPEATALEKSTASGVFVLLSLASILTIGLSVFAYLQARKKEEVIKKSLVNFLFPVFYGRRFAPSLAIVGTNDVLNTQICTLTKAYGTVPEYLKNKQECFGGIDGMILGKGETLRCLGRDLKSQLKIFNGKDVDNWVSSRMQCKVRCNVSRSSECAIISLEIVAWIGTQAFFFRYCGTFGLRDLLLAINSDNPSIDVLFTPILVASISFISLISVGTYLYSFAQRRRTQTVENIRAQMHGIATRAIYTRAHELCHARFIDVNNQSEEVRADGLIALEIKKLISDIEEKARAEEKLSKISKHKESTGTLNDLMPIYGEFLKIYNSSVSFQVRSMHLGADDLCSDKLWEILDSRAKSKMATLLDSTYSRTAMKSEVWSQRAGVMGVMSIFCLLVAAFQTKPILCFIYAADAGLLTYAQKVAFLDGVIAYFALLASMAVVLCLLSKHRKLLYEERRREISMAGIYYAIKSQRRAFVNVWCGDNPNAGIDGSPISKAQSILLEMRGQEARVTNYVIDSIIKVANEIDPIVSSGGKKKGRFALEGDLAIAKIIRYNGRFGRVGLQRNQSASTAYAVAIVGLYVPVMVDCVTDIFVAYDTGNKLGILLAVSAFSMTAVGGLLICSSVIAEKQANKLKQRNMLSAYAASRMAVIVDNKARLLLEVATSQQGNKYKNMNDLEYKAAPYTALSYKYCYEQFDWKYVEPIIKRIVKSRVKRLEFKKGYERLSLGSRAKVVHLAASLDPIVLIYKTIGFSAGSLLAEAGMMSLFIGRDLLPGANVANSNVTKLALAFAMIGTSMAFIGSILKLCVVKVEAAKDLKAHIDSQLARDVVWHMKAGMDLPENPECYFEGLHDRYESISHRMGAVAAISHGADKGKCIQPPLGLR